MFLNSQNQPQNIYSGELLYHYNLTVPEATYTYVVPESKNLYIDAVAGSCIQVQIFRNNVEVFNKNYSELANMMLTEGDSINYSLAIPDCTSGGIQFFKFFGYLVDTSNNIETIFIDLSINSYTIPVGKQFIPVKNWQDGAIGGTITFQDGTSSDCPPADFIDFEFINGGTTIEVDFSDPENPYYHLYGYLIND